ncbi:MAG: hypothetical protein ACE5D3_04800 [Candidatus Binatia bacterium]
MEIVEQITAPAASSTSKGDVVRISATTGDLVKTSAASKAKRGEAVFIAIRNSATNGAVTAVRQGVLDVGEALSALNYGAKVYMSVSTGKISNTVGTVSTGCAVIGTVDPGWAYTTADKLLRVNIRPQSQQG